MGSPYQATGELYADSSKPAYNCAVPVGREGFAPYPTLASGVIPGGLLKAGDDKCVVTLLTWRLATQTDAEWEQFCCIHEAEMFLIKGLLERE